MRAQKALSIVAFILLVVLNGVSVSAQEAVPETPPELRDFRLDPPRSQPQPETQPQPTVEPVVTAPPPAVSTVPAPQRAEPPRRAQPEPETTRRISPLAETTPAEPTTSEPEVPDKAGLPAPETNAAPITPAPATITKADSAEPDLPYWQIAAGLGALGLLSAIALLVRRRRAKPPEDHVVAAPEIEPEPVANVTPAPVPAAKTVPKPKRAPLIKIDFIPEKATITFATLTVKGQLQISNEGQADAKDMELRAGLISASQQQQEATDLFFSTSHDITPNAMGDAKAGERLGVALELSVPLSEMHSFPLGDQRLLVPIILATLEYRSDNQSSPQRAEIAYMIGREATPPKPKMGPLRLDLGPRSFAPLGTRPLYT
jgi:hypothetical protein